MLSQQHPGGKPAVRVPVAGAQARGRADSLKSA